MRALIVMTLLAACSSAPLRESEPRNGRLPDDVRPLAYALSLDVDLHQGNLSGEVAIQTQLASPRRSIWLHARDLKIAWVRVNDAKVTHEQVGDLLHVVLADLMQPQIVTIDIAYERTIPQGVLIAELGPMNARGWFPCFDEPRFKATFDIAITAPTDALVVTASRPRHVETGRWEFERTPPLPAHLLTFVVGDVDVVESGRVRAIAPRGGDLEALRSIADEAPPILEELERYFGTPYPFDKLDIIATPHLSTGALENAAAPTFRSQLILVDRSDEQARRSATEALAHELAHMWFGDSVTMGWWDDLWLSESFASWLGHKVTHAEADRVEAALGAMQHDSLSSIHPVRHRVAQLSDVAFDPITYGKGMGIIAMVESYMGDEAFRDAVRRYVNSHRFGTATTDDFVAALENPQAAAIMRSFIEQPGVPYVSANVACPSITLKQERYVPLGGTASAGQTWTIPICAGDECWLLDAPQATFTMKTCSAEPMLNHEARGYYRFAPPASLRGLSATELLAAADSLAASVMAGKTTASAFLQTLPAFVAKHDTRLDHRVMETFTLIRDHHLDEGNRAALAVYAYKLFGRRPHGLSAIVDETPMARAERNAVAYFLLDVGNDKELQSEAIKLGRNIVTRPTYTDAAIDADLGALCLAVAAETPEVRARLLERLRLPNHDAESERVLSFSRDPEIARAVLAERLVDAESVLTRYLAHAETRDVAKAAIRQHRGEVHVQVAASLCSDEDSAWIREQFPTSERATTEVAETVALCAALDRAQHAPINAYFHGSR